MGPRAALTALAAGGFYKSGVEEIPRKHRPVMWNVAQMPADRGISALRFRYRTF